MCQVAYAFYSPNSVMYDNIRVWPLYAVWNALKNGMVC